MQLDVFTLLPHAFAWLTEQRPVAAVLGDELELRLLSYRDYTPLTGGQVDDEPYGGGAGMVLRVDVVAAALDAVYGGTPDHRVIALTPQGRQLTQAVVEELAAEERLTLLSARFEGFDERVLAHLASDSISIGPYVLSGGELPAMVLVDAIARRLPGALGSAESGLVESFSAELEGGLEYPHYTRPADFRGWRVPDVLLSGGELPAMVLVDAVARRLPGALTEGSGEHESFSPGLEGGLEYPQYTRPAEFRGWRVPDVLLSGDHGRIGEWRKEQSRLRTGS